MDFIRLTIFVATILLTSSHCSKDQEGRTEVVDPAIIKTRYEKKDDRPGRGCLLD